MMMVAVKIEMKMKMVKKEKICDHSQQPSALLRQALLLMTLLPFQATLRHVCDSYHSVRGYDSHPYVIHTAVKYKIFMRTTNTVINT